PPATRHLHSFPTRRSSDLTFQNMPLEGYTRMFERMLDHPNIRVEVHVDFFALRSRVRARHVVYTGPIDAFFDHCYGRLPYRSLRSEEHTSELQSQSNLVCR